MPENWVSDFMAMCCGLSLALALGWNVTAGAADWKELAQNLCLVPGSQAAANAVCQSAVVSPTEQVAYLGVTLSP